MPFSAGFPFTETDAPRLSGMTVSRYCPAATFSTTRAVLCRRSCPASAAGKSSVMRARRLPCSRPMLRRIARPPLAPACEKVTQFSRAAPPPASGRPASLSRAARRSGRAAPPSACRCAAGATVSTCTTAEAALPFSSSADRVTGVFSLRAGRQGEALLVVPAVRLGQGSRRAAARSAPGRTA